MAQRDYSILKCGCFLKLSPSSRRSPINSPRPQLDTTLRVGTPEKISFVYQTVGPFRRLFAYMLDLFLVGALLFGLGILLTLLYLFVILPLLLHFGFGGLTEEIGVSLLGVAGLIGCTVFWFYGAFQETYRNGQTWGKSIAKIQVLSVDGYAIDGVQAMTRNLFRYLDLLPFVPATLLYVFEIEFTASWMPTCLIGLICMTISPRYQRIGDLIAGTMVVLVEKKWVPDLTQFEDARVSELADLIPANFQTTPSMANALSTYGDARPRLATEHRAEIAANLAVPLKEKFGFPADTDNDLLLCALYYRTYAEVDDLQSDVEHDEDWLLLKEKKELVPQPQPAPIIVDAEVDAEN